MRVGDSDGRFELFRASWRGELAATFGEAALPADIRLRVIGTRRKGDQHAAKIDPADKNRYLHGGRSVPSEVIEETIRVKDSKAPGGVREQALRIRLTKRGPVISDRAGLGPGGDKELVLRSTYAELLGPVLGYEGLRTAKDAAAFDREDPPRAWVGTANHDTRDKGQQRDAERRRPRLRQALRSELLRLDEDGG